MAVRSRPFWDPLLYRFLLYLVSSLQILVCIFQVIYMQKPKIGSVLSLILFSFVDLLLSNNVPDISLCLVFCCHYHCRFLFFLDILFIFLYIVGRNIISSLYNCKCFAKNNNVPIWSYHFCLERTYAHFMKSYTLKY